MLSVSFVCLSVSRLSPIHHLSSYIPHPIPSPRGLALSRFTKNTRHSGVWGWFELKSELTRNAYAEHAIDVAYCRLAMMGIWCVLRDVVEKASHLEIVQFSYRIAVVKVV
ncbi:hypothetical protein J3E69DRAFT_349469 [Trichoderma sp. SZMC 28015]